MKAVVKV